MSILHVGQTKQRQTRQAYDFIKASTGKTAGWKEEIVHCFVSQMARPHQFLCDSNTTFQPRMWRVQARGNGTSTRPPLPRPPRPPPLEVAWGFPKWVLQHVVFWAGPPAPPNPPIYMGGGSHPSHTPPHFESASGLPIYQFFPKKSSDRG